MENENKATSTTTMTIPPMEIDPMLILTVRYLDLTNEVTELKRMLNTITGQLNGELAKIDTIFNEQLGAIERLQNSVYRNPSAAHCDAPIEGKTGGMVGAACGVGRSIAAPTKATVTTASAAIPEVVPAGVKKEKVTRPKKGDVVKPATIDTTSADEGDAGEEILL